MPFALANAAASAEKVELRDVGAALQLMRGHDAEELTHFLHANDLALPVLALNDARHVAVLGVKPMPPSAPCDWLRVVNPACVYRALRRPPLQSPPFNSGEYG